MAVQISGNDITVPRDGTFSRNVSIAGTLTYEDVTNVDSIGIVTARNGIEVGASPGVAASISVDGNMIVSGITTFGDNIHAQGKIGINTDDPTARLEIIDSKVRTWDPTSQTELLVERNGNCLLSIVGGTSSNTVVNFGDADDENIGNIDYDHANNSMVFRTNASERARIESAGNVNVSQNLNVAGVVTATTFESSTFSKTPTNTPAFHAYYSGNTSPSLSNNTWTKVTFLTTETLDTDSAYDGSKFTVPSGKGGYYQVATSMNFYADNNDMKNARVAIYKNGSVAIQSYNHINNYAAGLRHLSVSQSGVLNLSASDYLEVYVNITTNGASAGYLSNDANGVRGNFFSAFKLII